MIRTFWIALPALLLLVSDAPAEVLVKDGKVTANLQSAPLQQVLDQLRRQTGVRMTVDDDVNRQTISASFRDLPLAHAVKKMLEGTGVNYVVLGDENGTPQSIFIGSSEKPGAPPRRLDNRPVNLPNRGVVTPVAPVPPPPVPNPARQQPQNQPPTKPMIDTTVDVPTGGGFVPQGTEAEQNQNQQQPNNQAQPNQPQQQPQDDDAQENEIIEDDEEE